MFTYQTTYSTLILAITALAFISSSSNADTYTAPRLNHGSPDFQGTWTNVSLTYLQRSARYKNNILSAEEAAAIEQNTAARQARGLKPTDPNAPPPPKGSNVGGYNSFYLDQGDNLAYVDGAYRTTWLVNQEDGQLPYSEAGKKVFDENLYQVRNDFSGPETRPMAERCIIGFGSTAGPPMLNVQYNNNYQIVQTPNSIMILVEMNHDARIIRMQGEPLPNGMTQWFGDSIGRWEGDTLVVETRKFNPGESLRTWFNQSLYISPNAVVTERFTRVSDSQIHYEFSVDDPTIYSETWHAKMVFNKTNEPIYEYACHEGNYAMTNILSGARATEEVSR
ncbi:hypothetical protein [Aurantivibrio plasticivorans]